MTNMKLEIKHLKHYLDCGLKIINTSDDYVYNLSEIWNSYIPDEFHNEFGKIIFEQILNDSKLKPIFYSLDWLTKPIWHNGESFVPIERLFEINYPNHKSKKYFLYEKGYYTNYFEIQMNSDFKIYTHEEFINKNEFWVIEKLIEWRFNVFNLPKELIVEVSEDFNPYK